MVCLAFAGCAPISKFASYRPPFASDNYTIEVELQNKIPAEYSLSINKAHIVDLVWSGMSYEQQAKGIYQGKEVIMTGHFFPGPRTVIDVEISGEKAAQFDFIF
jgi:hypothetical protein